MTIVQKPVVEKVEEIEVDGLDEQPCKLELHNEDCFGAFKRVKDKTVDLFLLDLPYGQTACKWDSMSMVCDIVRNRRVVDEMAKRIFLI